MNTTNSTPVTPPPWYAIFAKRYRILEEGGYFFPQWRRWVIPIWEYCPDGDDGYPAGEYGCYACFGKLAEAREYVRCKSVPPPRSPSSKIHSAYDREPRILYRHQ